MNINTKIIVGDSRKMVEVDNNTIGLVVTSPPYWNIKDYGVQGQIGYGQTLHEYLKSLYCVWKECYRVLIPGRRLCINIGDQFARSIIFGRYKVIPLHSEFITQCEEIGFDYMGSIIWQKKTTMNTTGGATVMGSYPYPPNGMIEIDYEFILIFKKPGDNGKIPQDIKEKSVITKEEWKKYFYGHWFFGGTRQIEHEAMFPDELPMRLIKMFTFVHETVLDPFLGSGTTTKTAMALNRNSIGYEINENYLTVIKEKLGIKDDSLNFSDGIEIIKRTNKIGIDIDNTYIPRIKDAEPIIEPKLLNFKNGGLYRVVEIINANTIKLNTGLIVKFLGVDVTNEEAVKKYLSKYVLKKEVFLKFDDYYDSINKKIVEAYVYLKNKIFINSYLIKSGIATADRLKQYKYKNTFIKIETEYHNAKGMDIKSSKYAMGFNKKE